MASCVGVAGLHIRCCCQLSATIPCAASRRTTAPRLASWLSRADVVPSKAAAGIVNDRG